MKIGYCTLDFPSAPLGHIVLNLSRAQTPLEGKGTLEKRQNQWIGVDDACGLLLSTGRVGREGSGKYFKISIHRMSITHSFGICEYFVTSVPQVPLGRWAELQLPSSLGK